MTDEQYLILSSFAYFTPNLSSQEFKKFFELKNGFYFSDSATFFNTCEKVFLKGEGIDIFKVYSGTYNSKNKRVLYKNLYKVKDFKIIGYLKDKNGYEGYAFLNEKNELIFVAKGTKITKIKDIITDFRIVLTRDIEKLPQFKTHLFFVNKVIKTLGYKGVIYFGGHSLGGGLAQFAIYEKMGELKKAECITFNAVGIYQDLYNACLQCKNFDRDNFRIIDYSFNYDLVGSFGEDVGESKYLESFTYFNLLEYHSVYNFYDFVDNNGYFTEFGEPILSNLKPLRWYLNHKLKKAYENRTMDKTEINITNNDKVELYRNGVLKKAGK